MNLFTFFLILVNLIILKPIDALNEDECICKPYITERIVNGRKSEQNYPWLAEIYATGFENGPVCSATILNERYLLSAASCMPKEANQIDQMKIKITGFKEFINVEKVILHPDFENELYDAHNDIALIKINETLKFNEQKIAPGCLDIQVTSFYAGFLHFAGRGSKEPVRIDKESGIISNFKPSENLLEAEGLDKTNTQKECKKNLSANLCIKTKNSLCLGEQGTAIQYIQNGSYFIVGVASIPIAKDLDDKTVELCTSGIKAARVSKYIGWIKENLDNSEFCTGYKSKIK